MTPIESLLRAHIRDARESIAASVARVDALEATVDKLSHHTVAAPVAAPCDKVRRLNSWSEEEDALIREHYPQFGAPGVQKLIPHRTVMAVRVRATRWLKVTRQIGPGVHIARQVATWCDQCQHRVSSYQIAGCKSPFCKAKDAA